MARISENQYFLLIIKKPFQLFFLLEIKPCGFESTIRDMEAERYKDK
jgi:hypothetical protein